MAAALAEPPTPNLFSASDRCRPLESFELRASWCFLKPVNSLGRNRLEPLGDGGEAAEFMFPEPVEWNDVADRDVFIGELGAVCEPNILSTVVPGMRDLRTGPDEDAPSPGTREELDWERPTEAGADGGGRGSANLENGVGTAGGEKPPFAWAELGPGSIKFGVLADAAASGITEDLLFLLFPPDALLNGTIENRLLFLAAWGVSLGTGGTGGGVGIGGFPSLAIALKSSWLDDMLFLEAARAEIMDEAGTAGFTTRGTVDERFWPADSGGTLGNRLSASA